MLFDAHCHAFTVFGGVPERGIYNNMKTAIDRGGRGEHRRVNTCFQAMVSHSLYEADFCNAAWSCGQSRRIIETGNDSYRFKHYTTQQQQKKTREFKPD